MRNHHAVFMNATKTVHIVEPRCFQAMSCQELFAFDSSPSSTGIPPTDDNYVEDLPNERDSMVFINGIYN